MDPATILMNPDATFDGQFSRIQLVIKATTLSEFAGFFGIHPSAIGAARRRGKIPSDWLVILMRAKGVLPDWVLTGRGPCHAPVLGRYEVYDEDAAEQEEDRKALRRLSSSMLANEMVRRIAVAENGSVAFPGAVIDLVIFEGKSLIQAWREFRSMDREQIAEAIEVPLEMYAEMEAPDAKVRRAVLFKIARALKVDLRLLID